MHYALCIMVEFLTVPQRDRPNLMHYDILYCTALLIWRGGSDYQSACWSQHCQRSGKYGKHLDISKRQYCSGIVGHPWTMPWMKQNRSGLKLVFGPVHYCHSKHFFLHFLSLSLVSVFESSNTFDMSSFPRISKKWRLWIVITASLRTSNTVSYIIFIHLLQRQMTRYIAKRYRFNWLQW